MQIVALFVCILLKKTPLFGVARRAKNQQQSQIIILGLDSHFFCIITKNFTALLLHIKPLG